MRLLDPKPPPYEPLAWAKLPFGERARLACESWALDGYGTPPIIYAVHAVKLVGFAALWVVWCGFSPGLGNLATIGAWWTSPVAFQKAIIWAMLFESVGLGCGFGPLTGRYFPPVGGALYFLRKGTTKLPLFQRLPLLGGATRTWLDVALYGAILVTAVRILVLATPTALDYLPLAVLVPVIGIADRTVFLALRAEHYWTVIVCFVATEHWLPGAKAVQLALWFWAGISKLNHHFPTTVCVMTSNSPVARFPWLRRRLYRAHPGDLRPSRFAVLLAHGGTALELTVASVLALAPGGPWIYVGVALALGLHAFITTSVPMGVPIEWNLMAVYAVFALFWAHPEVSVLAVGATPLTAVLLVMLVGVPIVGNLVPSRVSFLLAMRYYAGNWPYSVWLFRGESYRKLGKLATSAPWIYDQLDRFYDRATGVGLVGKVLAFRLMHLHGRVLPGLVAQAVDRIEDYEYLDGELVAGLVLGWNFGDGHLHREQLLHNIQRQCDFEPGELRCIFVEAQPLGRSTLAWRICDASTGQLAAGEAAIATLRSHQPWEAPAADG